MMSAPQPTLVVNEVAAVADPIASAILERGHFAAISVPDPTGEPWTLSCGFALLSIECRRGSVIVDTPESSYAMPGGPLAFIDRMLERLRCRNTHGLPFEGGLVGFLGYELLDPPDVARHAWPDLSLLAPTRFRLERRGEDRAIEVRLADLPDPDQLAVDLGGRAVSRARGETAAEAAAWSRVRSGSLAPSLTERDFCRMVERCLGYVARGDIYQANLSHRLRARFHRGAFELFADLYEQHPTPHASFLHAGPGQLVGSSPELFLRRRGERVTTRPIKGTRPRGTSAALDARLSRTLSTDVKENAEHVMIVDLERNDLGRVARTGTVEVERLADVESFGTLHHLVSTISAQVDRDLSVGRLLAATFPGGSVTGAPKTRAREIIRELEPGPRGPYTGATGWLDARGDVELAIAIRTALVRGSRVEYGTGAGIVADSDPEAEWRETLLKAEALNRVLATPRPPLWRERSRARRLTRGVRIE